jgi:hypothetical protein
MNGAAEVFLVIVVIVSWIAGAVVASGVWSTIFAVCIPFWAWYLVFERVMQSCGII